jgi:hypothetical protein
MAPIQIGDLLVTSKVKGIAMKSEAAEQKCTAQELYWASIGASCFGHSQD